MKEVVNDLRLRDPKTIGHVFTKETKGKLRVGREDFLSLKRSKRFVTCLRDMGRLLRFYHEKSDVLI